MGDWIDEQLQNLENWIYQGHDIPDDHSVTTVPITGWRIPPLSGMVRDARYVYDFAVMRIPNHDLLRDHMHTLHGLSQQADALAKEFEASLGPLKEAWSGPEADAYYSPVPTSTERASGTPSPALAMHANLLNVRDAFAHNAWAHSNMASAFDGMSGHQTELYLSLGGAVVGLGALVAFPPDFEISGPEISLTLANGIKVTIEIERLAPLIQIALDIADIDALINVAAFALVAIAILSVAGDTVGTTTANQAKKVVLNNPKLTGEQEVAVDELLDELAKLISKAAKGYKGIRAEWIEYLIGLICASGVSIEVAKDLIRCLASRGWLLPSDATLAAWSADYAKVWNIIVDQLQPDDIQAAWMDMRDIPVIDRFGNLWKSHLTKVSDALRSLQEMLDSNDLPHLSAGFKDAIRKTIAWVESKVLGDDNPLSWKDKGRVPFWNDVLKNSGCLKYVTGKSD